MGTCALIATGEDWGDVADGNDYESRIELALAGARAKHGNDLLQICRAMRGLFPTEVFRRLPSQRLSFDAAVGDISADDIALPEPHPIDFDWRFTKSAAALLAERVEGFEHVLCVGTPTVFQCLMTGGLKTCLIDQNPLLASALAPKPPARIITADIRRIDLSGESFDAVLLDPPWYTPSYHAWLAAVLPSMRLGSRLVIVLFPELVRPTAASERSRLLAVLSRIGPLTVSPESVTYQTPPFEADVLRVGGLPLLAGWRRADLIEVNVMNPSAVLNDGLVHHDPPWARYVIGSQVVALANDETDGQFAYSAPGRFGNPFHLSSVSLRDPHRRSVNVWTSRNRAATASGTRSLQDFLQRLACGDGLEIASRRAGRAESEALNLRRLAEDLSLTEHD